MVFFSCNLCGESLKKNAVEKHSFKCQFSTVSCLDCSKEFSGSSYSSHISCITEAEKYGGPNHVTKETKGKLKQQKWVENIQQIVNNSTNLDSNLKAILERISSYDNIPMKEKKFKNFLFSSLKIRENIANNVWKVFQQALTCQTSNNANEKEYVNKNVKENITKTNDVNENKENTIKNNGVKESLTMTNVKSEALKQSNENSKKNKRNKSKENCDLKETLVSTGAESKEPSKDIQICNGTEAEKKSKKKKKSKSLKREEALENIDSETKEPSNENPQICNGTEAEKKSKKKKKSKSLKREDDVTEALENIDSETKEPSNENPQICNGTEAEKKSKKKKKSKSLKREDDVTEALENIDSETKEPSNENPQICNGTEAEKKSKKKKKKKLEEKDEDLKETLVNSNNVEGIEGEDRTGKDIEKSHKKKRGKSMDKSDVEEQEENPKKRKMECVVEIEKKKAKHAIGETDLGKMEEEIQNNSSENKEKSKKRDSKNLDEEIEGMKKKKQAKIDNVNSELAALTNTDMQNGETTGDMETSMNGAGSSFKWKSAIKKALEEAPDSGMKLKKLQNKIVEQYLASFHNGDEAITKDAAIEIFNKKILNDKYLINDKSIKLKS